jgi:hypothetical protein
LTTFGQAPNWTWAKSGQGAGQESSTKITVDLYGNIFAIGAYQSDSISFETNTLYNSGGWDIFILKYDSLGNLLWAKSFGNNGDELAYSCKTDAIGNLIVTGMFNSDSMTIDNTTITNNGITDIFILKCDSLGNMLWFKGEGSTGNDQGFNVTIDIYGNIYTSGWYDSPSISFGTYTLPNQGGGDVFVVKYDESGNVIWAKGAGGVGSEVVSSGNCDNFGNFYLVGNFNSTNITFDTNTLTNSGGNKMFIVKYNGNGNAIWARAYGNVGYQPVFDLLTSDASGNVYVAGYFNTSSITFGTFSITNSGNDDIFIVKHDSLGNVLWAKGEGNAGYDGASTICTDNLNNVYLGGAYSSPTITFGAFTLTNTDFSGNSTDIFLAKYDSFGNSIWAKGVGGTGIDYVGSLATYDLKNIYVNGVFSAPSITFGTTALTNVGNYDIFVAKMVDATLSINENDNNLSLIVYPNPFNFTTTIELNRPIINGHLFLYDLNNQLIKEINNVSGSVIIIDRECLPSGIYLVRIFQDNFILTSKLVITD